MKVTKVREALISSNTPFVFKVKEQKLREVQELLLVTQSDSSTPNLW